MSNPLLVFINGLFGAANFGAAVYDFATGYAALAALNVAVGVFCLFIAFMVASE